MSTYAQIYIHIVFSVKNRDCLIRPEWEDHLHRYITGIVHGKGHRLLAIGGTSNHIHMLIGLTPSGSISDLVREIKKSSTSYIRENYLKNSSFHWQDGYGAFSYSQSHYHRVIDYILNQKQHHAKRTFREEYTSMLLKYKVDFDPRFFYDPDAVLRS